MSKEQSESTETAASKALPSSPGSLEAFNTEIGKFILEAVEQDPDAHPVTHRGLANVKWRRYLRKQHPDRMAEELKRVSYQFEDESWIAQLLMAASQFIQENSKIDGRQPSSND